mgnify:CR=1 FL=1
MLLRHPAFSRPHPLTLAILLALGSHAATTQAQSNGAAVQRAMFDLPAGPLARSAHDLTLAMDVLSTPLQSFGALGWQPAAWRDAVEHRHLAVHQH